MEHFAFPGNIDFAADDQRIFHVLFVKGSCVYSSGLFIYETMFTIGESRAISHSDGTEQQTQQVDGNPRFLTETTLENAD